MVFSPDAITNVLENVDNLLRLFWPEFCITGFRMTVSVCVCVCATILELVKLSYRRVPDRLQRFFF